MAGTGKSMISSTVAETFADKCQLWGDFFFKRGEDDRSNASIFFTTITNHLAIKFSLSRHLSGRRSPVIQAFSKSP